jgi:glycosyltransferase EpsF
MRSKDGDPPKVLHIISTFSMGGVETWLLGLLRYWRRKGFQSPQIDFLAVGGERDLLDDEATALGAKIIYLRYGRSNLIKFSREFRQILARGGYSVIHDHQGYQSGWHFLVGAGLLPPIRVAHIHNTLSNLQGLRRFIAWIGKNLVGILATHIVGTSRQLMAECGFDPPGFSRIPKFALYCGIDAARFLKDPVAAKVSICGEFGLPEHAKIILCVGRIDPTVDPCAQNSFKNSGFSVSVGIEYARQDPCVYMLLVGAVSPAVRILENRIVAAGLSERIKFVGIRRDVERLMLASDVLLFPSRSEGLGLVAVEAQAAGLPVLASSAVPRECVIVPEIVRFQEIEAGIAEWIAGLRHLMALPRNVVEANKRVSASAFAIENSANAMVALYTI